MTFTDNTHLKGKGYTVEQITFYNNIGQKLQVFSTKEYVENPHGFFQDHWIIGKVLMILGFILATLAFLIPLLWRKGRNP